MSISVIIPTYNRPEELLRCLQSVFCQILQPNEIYVIDNSLGNTNKEILQKHEFDKKIIFLKMRGSVDQLRNKISSIVKSNYIAFLDDDDVWHEEYLKKNYEIIKKKNLDIIYSSMNIVDEKRNILSELILNKDIDIQDLLLFNNGFFLSNMIVKKSTFINLGGLHTKSGSSDRDILIRIIKKKYNYYFNSQILLNRQVNENNWSQDDFKMLKMNILFFFNYFNLMNLNTKFKYFKKIIKIFLSSIGYKKFNR